jgi:Spy/CpxP family protein refolding chaperone
LALLRIDAVKKELELLDDQVAAIQKLEEEMRASRPQRGQGNRGQGNRGQRNRGGAGGAPRRPAAQDGTSLQFAPGQYFVQQPGQRQGRPELTEEQRARIEEFRKQAAERQKKENEKLAEILLPHQMKRLNEIYIQQLGIAALQNEEIAGKLKITDDQKKKMEEVTTANRQEMGAQMRELFQGGGDQIREKITAMRKKADEKVLAVLTGAQKKEFEDMKGKPFEMPQGALRGPGRGGPGGGNRRPGGGNNRPAPDA